MILLRGLGEGKSYAAGFRQGQHDLSFAPFAGQDKPLQPVERPCCGKTADCTG